MTTGERNGPPRKQHPQPGDQPRSARWTIWFRQPPEIRCAHAHRSVAPAWMRAGRAGRKYRTGHCSTTRRSSATVLPPNCRAAQDASWRRFRTIPTFCCTQERSSPFMESQQYWINEDGGQCGKITVVREGVHGAARGRMPSGPVTGRGAGSGRPRNPTLAVNRRGTRLPIPDRYAGTIPRHPNGPGPSRTRWPFPCRSPGRGRRAVGLKPVRPQAVHGRLGGDGPQSGGVCGVREEPFGCCEIS